MHYTIYKTTNLINGKYYIGKHQTRNLDDGYFGSGKRLKYAIRKYGIENFVTDILFVFDEEWKMNLAEKILVVPDVETNYNLCPGGKGGFGFINSSIMKSSWVKLGREIADINGAREKAKIGIYNMCPLSKRERALKIVDIRRKNGNEKVPDGRLANIGKVWITNGVLNKKINKGDNLPDGYRYGAVFKRK